MSDSLPGGHYCKEHQGNLSHYDKENCEVCKLRAEIAHLKDLLGKANALARIRAERIQQQDALIEQCRKGLMHIQFFQEDMAHPPLQSVAERMREIAQEVLAAIEKEQA